MVQCLTNPMLAQIPLVLLAAHAGPIVCVETNYTQWGCIRWTPPSASRGR
jgi:hypothetical protein